MLYIQIHRVKDLLNISSCVHFLPVILYISTRWLFFKVIFCSIQVQHLLRMAFQSSFVGNDCTNWKKPAIYLFCYNVFYGISYRVQLSSFWYWMLQSLLMQSKGNGNKLQPILLKMYSHSI